MGDGLGFQQQAVLLQQADDLLPGLLHVHTAHKGHAGGDHAVGHHHLLVGQAVLLHPLHVGGVAEGGAHHRAGALVDGGLVIGDDGHLEAVQGHLHGFAHVLLIPLVLRVDEHAHHAVQQLGPGGGDLNGALLPHEGDVVEGGVQVFRLQLRLGDGGLALGAPQHRGLLDIGPARLGQLDKGLLGQGLHLPADGGVLQVPVAGEAHGLPQGLELRLVLLGGGHALLAELAAGQLLGLHAALLLHQPLGGQAVVVEAEGVEHVEAPHTAVTGHHLRLGVAENVADVELAVDGGGRRVDGIDGPGGVGGELVDLVLPPELLHGFLHGEAVISLFKFLHGCKPPEKPPRGAENDSVFTTK